MFGIFLLTVWGSVSSRGLSVSICSCRFCDSSSVAAFALCRFICITPISVIVFLGSFGHLDSVLLFSRFLGFSSADLFIVP